MKQAKIILLLCGLCCAFIGAAVRAEMEQHRSNPMGAGTTTLGVGRSHHNLGQSVIGISSGASEIAYQGSLYGLVVYSDCQPCDVNNDGFVNGVDIQPYTRIKTTGIGTPAELCAAQADIPTFVSCLLSP